VGTRVRVVLHGRRVGGWVVADDDGPRLSGVELRELAAVSGWGPPEPLIQLADWAAWRWAGPAAAFLRTASPDRNVANLPETPTRWTTAALADDEPGDGAAELRSAAVAALGQVDIPTIVRIPPSTDLLPLVTEVLRLRAAPTGPELPHPGIEGPASVLVLVPGAGWAARLALRLARRGVPVASTWAEARAGWPVVVGTRAAAWSPLPRLAAVVVLDASDEAYREERAPTWNAWELLAERARRDGAPCVLTSSSPTVVQLAASRLQVVSRNHERGGWPRVTVVDRRAADPRTGLLSTELVEAARRHLAGPGRVVCVLNRTGRARLMACAACGELVRCASCHGAMEQAADGLRCRGCGVERPPVCAVCGSTRLKVLRPGVTRVREELEALLKVPVAEVSGRSKPDELPHRADRADRGSPAGSGGSHGLVALDGGDPEGSARALVGTEAVLHRVRHADLVAFLDFDQHLLAARFTAAEESLALVARAGRLVGGRATAPTSTVLVQTRIPQHEVLRAATDGDPGPLTRSEGDLRRRLSLPPASALALVSGPSGPAYVASIDAAGPLESADIGDGRWLVRAATTTALCDELAATARPRGRLRVEVDPTSV
jgi:primosomal protein N' (replication factor Y)